MSEFKFYPDDLLEGETEEQALARQIKEHNEVEEKLAAWDKEKRENNIHPMSYCDFCLYPGFRDTRHSNCQSCGQWTCNRPLLVHPVTKRQHKPFCCRYCADRASQDPDQRRLREERTRDDWMKVTDPLRPDLLERDKMPEQYPSDLRSMLRTFYDSDATEAMVLISSNSTSINQAIANLGLHKSMYAEQRSNCIVLRKVTT